MKLTLRAQIDRALKEARAKVMAELESIAKSGAQPTWLGLVAEVDAKQNVESFKTEGKASGDGWKALSPGYAEQKRAAIAGRKNLIKSGFHKTSPIIKGRPTSMNILVWSGAMRGSLTTASDSNRIVRWKPGLIELGTKHRLAPYHQQGTSRMVARPPVHKSAQQVTYLKNAIARGMLTRMSVIAGGSSNAFSRYLGRMAGQIRVRG